MKVVKEKYDSFVIPDTSEIHVIVCYILTGKGDVGVGIAVRSDCDEHDETEGKRMAMNRALRALKGRRMGTFRHPKAVRTLIRTRCPFTKHGYKNPELAYHERRMLFGKKYFKYEYKPFFHTGKYVMQLTKEDTAGLGSGVISFSGKFDTVDFVHEKGGKI